MFLKHNNKENTSFTISSRLVGVKITTIQKKDGTCPRGGEGCGVCASLDGVYCITEELDKTSKKDTSRLLVSGASKVYWLRALKSHLKEGLEALFTLIPDNTALVCESNKIRAIIKPGIFLLVKDWKLQVFFILDRMFYYG